MFDFIAPFDVPGWLEPNNHTSVYWYNPITDLAQAYIAMQNAILLGQNIIFGPVWIRCYRSDRYSHIAAIMGEAYEVSSWGPSNS